MRAIRRPRRPSLPGILAAVAIAACLLPASAGARKPIIAYLEGGQFKRFDAETGTDLAPLPVPANAGMRFAMSRNGRYVFYSSGGLHLFDRDLGTAGEEVPLPGINIYANPAFLTVSNNGVVAFDNNIMNGAVIYNPATASFEPTGFPPGMTTASEHRQPNLNGSGRFLATTCLMAASCEVDLGSDSNPYVQDLATQMDTGVPDDNTKDEEDPCISGDGDLVGWHKPGPGGDADLVIYRRSTATNITATLTGLNDPTFDDNHCAIDNSGNYIGYMQNNVFELYEISSLSQVTLPAKPFELSNNVNNILADPFTQSPRPMPTTPAGTPSTAVPKKKKCRRKHRRKGRAAVVAKKKRCKRRHKRR